MMMTGRSYAESADALSKFYKNETSEYLRHVIDREQQDGEFYSLEMMVAASELRKRGESYEGNTDV